MNTHTIVSDIHQNMLRTSETTDSQNRMVSNNRSPLSPIKSDRRVDPEQVSDRLLMEPPSYICI